MKDYTLTEQKRIGEALAKEFQLRPSTTHCDRWQLATWGDKTNLGIFNTFMSIAYYIREGDFHNLPGLADIQQRVNQNEER